MHLGAECRPEVAAFGMLAEPMAAAKVRFTIMGFSDTVQLRLHLADLRHASGLPQLTARGSTSYSAAFYALEQQLPVDLKYLKGQNYVVHRPAVFFLSDGHPSDGNEWWPIHERLTDQRRTPAAPNIIACGIGEADPQAILRVATKKEFAFVAIAGADVGSSIARFSSALTKSVVASGQSMSNGDAKLQFDRPEGFVMAIDVV